MKGVVKQGLTRPMAKRPQKHQRLGVPNTGFSITKRPDVAVSAQTVEAAEPYCQAGIPCSREGPKLHEARIGAEAVFFFRGGERLDPHRDKTGKLPLRPGWV